MCTDLSDNSAKDILASVIYFFICAHCGPVCKRAAVTHWPCWRSAMLEGAESQCGRWWCPLRKRRLGWSGQRRWGWACRWKEHILEAGSQGLRRQSGWQTNTVYLYCASQQYLNIFIIYKYLGMGGKKCVGVAELTSRLNYFTYPHWQSQLEVDYIGNQIFGATCTNQIGRQRKLTTSMSTVITSHAKRRQAILFRLPLIPTPQYMHPIRKQTPRPCHTMCGGPKWASNFWGRKPWPQNALWHYRLT